MIQKLLCLIGFHKWQLISSHYRMDCYGEKYENKERCEVCGVERIVKSENQMFV